MGELGTQTTRRGALSRMVLGAGALVGIGAGGVAVAKAIDGGGTPAPPAREEQKALKLHVRSLRNAPGLRDPRAGGAQDDAPFGELLDDSFRPIGDFRSASMTAGVSLHTFTLPDGQLFGLGAGGLEGSAHAIVGGTGSYAGASGSYAIEPAAKLPGRSVTFTLTLTALEA